LLRITDNTQTASQQLKGTRYDSAHCSRPEKISQHRTAKLLTIEIDLFIWRSSDQYDSTAPEAYDHRVDVINGYQWSDYNPIMIFTIEDLEMDTEVVSKKQALVRMRLWCWRSGEKCS
jgi:hypothetical protein